MRSENWTDPNEGKINGETFFNDLILTFPQLKEKIEGEDIDMIHFRMETFASYTIEQIKNKNLEELKRCFDFQESRIETANSELLNAMTVSYCESLLLGEVRYIMKDIIPLMGEKLKILYLEYEDYYNNLGNRLKSKDSNR